MAFLFLFYLLFILLFLQTSTMEKTLLPSVEQLISVQELKEQTFFSKYLPLPDQLSNRTICKDIKNITFENQTKRDIEYWIKHGDIDSSLFTQDDTLHKRLLNEKPNLSIYFEQRDGTKEIYLVMI